MKYYLTCEHCGHQNEVNSEFLTFCESCKKKLGNNYREWSRHNSGAEFETYLREACLSEASLSALNTPEVKKDGLSHWVGISITLAVLLGLGIMAIPTVFKMSVLSDVMKEEIRQKIPPDFLWKEYDLGSYGFSIESPFEMEKTAVPVADQLGEFVQNSESFSAMSNNLSFYFGVSIVEYRKELGRVDLERAMSMSAEAIRGQQDISNFDYSQREESVSGVPGLRQDGTYLQGGRKVRFINAGFTRSLVTWQIFAGFPEGDEGMLATAEKMLESMKIEYQTVY